MEETYYGVIAAMIGFGLYAGNRWARSMGEAVPSMIRRPYCLTGWWGVNWCVSRQPRLPPRFSKVSELLSGFVRR